VFPELMAHFETYNSVAFVRNPFQRFLSCINEHFKQYRPDEKLPELPVSVQLEIVESFICNELTISRIQADFRYVHFSPQFWFLTLGPSRKVKHILPLLSGGHFSRQGLGLLGLPATPLKSLNMMTTSLFSLLNYNIIRSFVMDFYRQDFQLLHADMALCPVILQSPVPVDMARIFATSAAMLPPPPAPKPHPVTRTFAALKPRKLVRRSVMKLRRTLGF
jgi:hypothetical protein